MNQNDDIELENTIRDSLEFYDNNQERFQNFFKKIKYVQFVNNNEIIDDILLYDNNKKLILESSYEILGVFVPKTNIWKWSWSIPNINKKYTYISRKILDYAFNLDSSTEIPLKSELINSKIKIINELQLDIHIAISSYIGKQPLIFKYYNMLGDKNTYSDDKGNRLYKYHHENTTDDNYMIFYLFILDYDNIID